MAGLEHLLDHGFRAQTSSRAQQRMPFVHFVQLAQLWSPVVRVGALPQVKVLLQPLANHRGQHEDSSRVQKYPLGVGGAQRSIRSLGVCRQPHVDGRRQQVLLQ